MIKIPDALTQIALLLLLPTALNKMHTNYIRTTSLFNKFSIVAWIKKQILRFEVSVCMFEVCSSDLQKKNNFPDSFTNAVYIFSVLFF